MSDYIADMGRKLPEAQTKYLQEQIGKDSWTVQKVSPKITGLKRDHYIIRAKRSSNLIKFAFHGDRETFCPPRWADMAIGSGACGFGCRSCFLMLTFRVMRDPLMPVIYTNDFRPVTKRFLSKIKLNCSFGKKDKRMMPATSLGLGIDCSDSLLYEGVTHNARRLIPLFSDPDINIYNKKLILLTKSANVHYLEDLPTQNTIVSFSLNPEGVADAWEGKYSDDRDRITPSIDDRLKASLKAEEMGFEVRWRIDPILQIENWNNLYHDFFSKAADKGHAPLTITLGTYREKNKQLDTWRRKWNLVENEFDQPLLVSTGTHRHLEDKNRIFIYQEVNKMIQESWDNKKIQPRISLCKETFTVRKGVNLLNDNCNCLDFKYKPRKTITELPVSA